MTKDENDMFKKCRRIIERRRERKKKKSDDRNPKIETPQQCRGQSVYEYDENE